MSPTVINKRLEKLRQSNAFTPDFHQAFLKAAQEHAPDHASQWQLSQESDRPSDPMQNPVPSRPVSSNLPLDVSSGGLE